MAEIFDIPSEEDFKDEEVKSETEPEPEPEKKKKKTKKELSAERRKKLLENLARGRETARKNREAKKRGEKPKEEKPKEKVEIENKKTDKVDLEKPPQREKKNVNDFNNSNEIKNEMQQLRNELKELKDMHEKRELRKEINKLKELFKEEKEKEKNNNKTFSPLPKTQTHKKQEDTTINQVESVVEPIIPAGVKKSVFNFSAW